MDGKTNSRSTFDFLLGVLLLLAIHREFCKQVHSACVDVKQLLILQPESHYVKHHTWHPS